MQAGPSDAPLQPKKRRVPQAGIAIMEAFMKENGRYPTREDRNALLCKIHAIPGGEHYDDKNISAWFKRRRTGDMARARDSNPNSPYPSLSAKALKHLATLASSNPFPTHSLITTWAELLIATPEDVTKWLAENRSPVHHLPTPVSTSPEPAPEYQWDMSSLKADPINSPVIPPRSAPIFCHTHVAQEPHRLSDHQLIEAIAETSRVELDANVLPTTLEEFESMFQSYHDRIESIIRQNEESLCP